MVTVVAWDTPEEHFVSFDETWRLVVPFDFLTKQQKSHLIQTHGLESYVDNINLELIDQQCLHFEPHVTGVASQYVGLFMDAFPDKEGGDDEVISWLMLQSFESAWIAKLILSNPDVDWERGGVYVIEIKSGDVQKHLGELTLCGK